MTIFVKNKQIVVPGTLIAEGNYNVVGPCIKEGTRYYATTVSLVEFKENGIKLTPLSGIYFPKVGDLVIGKIIEVTPVGWFVDINSPYRAFLALKEGVNEFVDITRTDISKYYDEGEYILCKVINVSKRGIVHVSTKETKFRKIKEGLIISITPSKVPRVIGKGGSMVKMIKEITGAQVIVGQNGRVWIKAENPEIETLVAQAIQMIDKASHISGLTEKVKRFLEENIKNIKK